MIQMNYNCELIPLNMNLMIRTLDCMLFEPIGIVELGFGENLGFCSCVGE